MQAQKVIERLGYKATEAKVYLAALSLGESTVSDIATKVKMPRTSVQAIVEKLHRDGLMNFYAKRRFKYWVAEKPDHFLENLRLREEELRSALPQLEKLRRKERAQGKTHVTTYEGPTEIRRIYDDMLETKQPMAGIIPWDEWVALLGRGFMEDFIENRVRRYLRMRLLAPKTPLAEELRARDAAELRETRLLPDDIPVSSTVLIYGTKVAIISLNKKLPVGIVIEDPEVRDTNAALFEELWERGGEKREGMRSSEGLFRTIADMSPQPLLIANQDAEIQYVNAAWEREFGYSAAEVFGKNPRILKSDKTPKRVYDRLWSALEKGQAFESDDIVNKRKDGTLRSLHTFLFPIHYLSKTYYVQILDDITNRKHVEAFREHVVRSAAEDMRPHLKSIRRLVRQLSPGEGPTVESELAQLDDIAKQLFDSSSAA
jgi:PAS domain S-box-containing protein